jgi:hypothetical protein
MRDWHVSRELVPFYALACLWFDLTSEGFLAANLLHHTIAAPLFAILVAFDSAQRRFTSRSFLNNI